MHPRHALRLIAVTVLLVISGCGPALPGTSAVLPAEARLGQALPVSYPAAASEPAVRTAQTPLPPTVIDVQPGRGQEQRLTAPIIITFDQPMDPETTPAAFSIEPAVPGTLEVAGSELVFSPSDAFERGTEYRVIVAETATNVNGLPLQKAVVLKFTTAGFLEVTSTQPAHGAAGVAVDTAITIAFNRPVVPLTGQDEQADLPQPLAITPEVAGKGEWLNTSIFRFTPDGGLAASTTYTVTVKAGLVDTMGALLAEPFTAEFRTVDPTVLAWKPESKQLVRIERPISVTFSMAMDSGSTEAAFTLADDTGAQVPGTFNWSPDGAELGFKPTNVLKFGTRYTAAVGLTARAANGLGTLRDLDTRSMVFTTVPLPKVIGSDPADGAAKADPYGGLTVRFAGPMNPASFVTGTLTILPKPTQVYTYYNDYDNALYMDFGKLPATDYVVTLSGRLADPYGNTLGKDTVIRFRTRDYPPFLELNGSVQVGTYNAYTMTEAVVYHRNLAEVSFDLYSVTADEFASLTAGEYWQRWDSFRPKETARVHQWTEATTAERNKMGVMRAPLLGAMQQPLPPGLYTLQLGAALAQGERAPRQLLVRSDLNVTLKASDTGALAWVTDLQSGQPVAGAAVRFTDQVDNDVSAVTGQDGVATATLPTPRRPWQPLLAFASTDSGSLGVASTAWQDGINPWDFGLPGGESSVPYMGYVYTDRPIYRPGQTVYWKAVMRRDNDAIYSLPAPGQPVTVTINDDQGNELLKERLTLSPLGSVDGKLALSADAALGYYFISVRLGEDEGSFGVGFQVAEYRKPEFEVSAQVSKPEYTQGDQVEVTVQANYYFGGPVKGGKVRWVLLSNDYSFAYREEGHWSFSDWDWWESARSGPYSGQLSEGEGTTDESGRLTFVAPADITKFKQSQRFSFDITVQDLNNQAVSTQASAIVHKGQFYVGLSPRSYVVTAGQPSQVDILTVDPQSEAVAAVPVTVVVNSVEWRSVREQAENGRFYWATRMKKTQVVTETLVTDPQGQATLTWTPESPGEYKIEASARDQRGHTISSAAYVWISGREYVPWRQENNDRIELVADRDEYAVGETAEILVPSPYAGRVKALLTIERGRVISHQVIELEGNSETISVPILPGYAPNVFVSLILMKGMDATSPSPSFKVGLVQLKVSVADKQVKVVLAPRRADEAIEVGGPGAEPKPFAPRETVVWDVQTLDATGKPVKAEVSLALIDKSVLSLAGDNAGKLMDRFYRQRGLGVATGATLVLSIDRLVMQLAEEGKGGGGGGGGGPTTVRSDFPDIAYWTATLPTDANGKASVEVTLPDNLTTWTMDARAVTADTRVGQATADIVATKSLLVRPVLPRFFVAGDQAEIAAVIHNTTPDRLEVAIELKADGLELPDETDSLVRVEANSTYKAAWDVTVADDAEDVKVTMSVAAQDDTTATARATTGGEEPLQDAVEVRLPVHRYTTPEVIGTSGQVGLGDSRLELLRLPADADPTRGSLTVTLEPSLAAGMLGGLDYLQHYPYECVEQTMSRFLPNVVTYKALKRLGISRPDLDAKLPQQVAVGLQRIYARQNVDGGWGWWQKDESNVAVTAYVVFGLAKAKNTGFGVDADVLKRGVRFLTQGLSATKDLSPWQLNQQAFTVYALAEAGQPEPNRAGALYEVRERLSIFGRAYLALALGLINDDASADRIQVLLADFSGQAVTSATGAHWEEAWTDYWSMNTDTRTSAIVIAALAQLDPQSSLAPNAVRWLMNARKADRWETTQENAWAIMALTDWMAATGELEGDYDWSVALNGAVLGEGAVTPATVQDVLSLRADIAQLLLGQTNALALDRSASGSQTGAGQLYYTVHLQTYEPVEQVQSRNRGLVVSREYRLAECGQTEPASGGEEREPCPVIKQARVGDTVEVRLTLIVPATTHYLIVEDPLPAGLEPVDTSLRITSQTAEGPSMERVTAGEGSWWDWWWTPTHVELRDEKAVLFATTLEPGTYQFVYQARASLPGRYLTLPPTGYQMYFPEVWGRGAGSVFTVTE